MANQKAFLIITIFVARKLKHHGINIPIIIFPDSITTWRGRKGTGDL